MSQKACFFDRDGCLIVEKNYLSNPGEVQLIPGAAKAVKLMRDNGYKIIVVSNQSGIARGYFTEKQLQQVEQRVNELFEAEGVTIDANYYCFHHAKGSVPEYAKECDCRKPRPGMLFQAAKEWDLNLTKCLMVGDKSSDVEAGLNASCRFAALVRTGHGTEQKLPDADNVVDCPDILSACTAMLRKCSVEDLAKADKAMASKKESKEEIDWYDASGKPMLLAGFNWFAQDHVYERLPVKKPEFFTQYPEGKKTSVPPEKCGAVILSPYNAGGRVYFRTNSRRIFLKYRLYHINSMDHMAFTGISGFDLYCREKPQSPWLFAGVTRSSFDTQDVESLELNHCMNGKMNDCVLHFPLYNGVKYLSIGVEKGALVEEFHPWKDPRKIVLYGTSITQGGCASRPGMASSNLLARDLAMDVLNFGFSGSGRGEPEIAEMLTQVPDPALFILDYDWNIDSVAEMAVTLPQVIDILRKKHPAIPILVISRSPSSDDAANPDCDSCRHAREKKRIQMDEVERRRKNGDEQIFFQDGSVMLGEDFWECMVDGCHMTDLGFYRWTKYLETILPAIIGKGIRK